MLNLSPKESKLSLAFALLILGSLLILSNFRGGTVSPSLANEPIRVEGFTNRLEEAGLSEEEKLPIKILIPDIDINLQVKRSPIIDGYWEVFEDSAGWGVDSGYPGEVGNQVIFAHAREGLFLPLKDIQTSTSMYVFTKSNWYEYKVTEIKEVYPDQIEVIAPTNDETLTLYTCSGFNDSKRLIVVAKRVVSAN